MIHKMLDALPRLQQARFFELVMASFITAAVFCAGCHEKPGPTAQPTPTALNVQGTSQKGATAEKRSFTSEEDAREYIKKEIEKENHKEVVGDEPIIVTDGSLHVKSPNITFEQAYDPNGDMTQLTHKKNGHVFLVYVVNHPDPTNETVTAQTTYRFSGDAHSKVTVRYRDAIGTDPNDFLTLTTIDSGDRLVLQSRVPFSRYDPPDLNTYEKVYESARQGGHEGVTVISDVPGISGDHPEKHGKSNVEYHYNIP